MTPDAKYTNPATAFDVLLPTMTMKYAHGIGARRGGFSPVKALFLLHLRAPWGPTVSAPSISAQ